MGLIKYLHFSLASATAASLLFVSSCSNSGGSAGGGAMFVETCSLGCSNGSSGLQVSCAVSQIFQNQELAVLFSEPVDIFSVNASTFQIINPANSDVPLGNFFLDPANPRRVVFRPALMLNNQTGQPEFGLDPNTTYLVTIPGVMQGDSPPYVMSASGNANQSRLQCTVTTTSDTVDLVPGPPQVSVTVDLRDTMSGGIIPDQPAEDAVDVALDTVVTMVFDDIMNSATLVNPDGSSDFIIVEVDEDGVTFDPSDRTRRSGVFTIDVDEVLLRTTVTFVPNNGFPTGGSAPIPRKVVITFPNSIQDLAGNGLLNSGELIFTPEIITFPPITLPDDDGENFTDTSNEDGSRSSADWGGGQVRLRFTSGGTGRLGDLRVNANETVVLNTDSQLFPIPDQPSTGFTGQEHDLMTNMIPVTDYDPTDPLMWPTITVTDGIFEFSSLRIASNGRVIFTGSNPARVQVRGEAFIGGVLDVSGVSPGEHDSQTQLGQSGGAGGPNGGAGGTGGARFDHELTLVAGVGGNASQFSDLVCKGALGHPTCMNCNADSFCQVSDYPGTFNDPTSMDGTAGEGVDQAMAGTLGGAPGGIHWPPIYPTGQSLTNAAIHNDLDFNRILPPLMGFDETGMEVEQRDCTSLHVSGTGGGGVYGRASQPSQPMAFFGNLESDDTDNDDIPDLPPQFIVLDEDGGTGTNNDQNVAVPTPPGDQASIGLDFLIRRLNPFFGHLRGGAGGGGAGTNLFGTTSGTFFGSCKGQVVEVYRDNSGAGGGGGGGALQLHSGTRVTVGGSIDASGGDGGSAMVASNVDQSSSAPGGGGSGGAVLVQAPVVDIAPVPGAINVAGGQGGLGVAGSIGGHGGGGLVSLADKVGGLDQLTEAMKILPFDPTIPDSNDILTIQNFPAPRIRPESGTASVSCWMRPEGGFSTLIFEEDDTSDPDPANHTFGWNMMLQIDTTPGSGTTIQLEPYRGPNSIMASSFEDAFGNMLNTGLPAGTGSPVAVRFQGARLRTVGADLCNLDLNGTDQDIEQGSLTPWVSHPAELNTFGTPSEMIRFCIIFDRDVDLATLDMVKGATDLFISAQPD